MYRAVDCEWDMMQSVGIAMKTKMQMFAGKVHLHLKAFFFAKQQPLAASLYDKSVFYKIWLMVHRDEKHIHGFIG